MDSFCSDIIDGCHNAGSESFPAFEKIYRKSCPLPDWKEYIQPLRDKSLSLFWHDIWAQCNKPKTDCVANIIAF